MFIQADKNKECGNASAIVETKRLLGRGAYKLVTQHLADVTTKRNLATLTERTIYLINHTYTACGKA